MTDRSPTPSSDPPATRPHPLLARVDWEAAGREADALTWFHRTQAIDAEEITDAADRADALERRLDPH